MSAKKQKELQEQLARALADYDNLRKRVERERGDLAEALTARLVSTLMPAFDMLFKAQEHLSDSGLAMGMEELKRGLGDMQIEEIPAEPGTSFDENLHEAVFVADRGKAKNKKKNEIKKLILAGWKFRNGPVIRHAKVEVAGNT